MTDKPVPRKVALAVTSYFGPFYDDGSKTGLFWSEAAHPFDVFTKAGFEVDLVSETGTVGLDEHSTKEPFLAKEDIEAFEDKSSGINAQLKSVKKASDLNPSDYGIFFAAGGHGVLFDFPNATNLLELASQIYDNGGIVSAVCHGPAIFENLKDKKTGEHLGKGKTLTGFTNLGEEQIGVVAAVKKYNLKFNQTVFEEIGATWSPPPSPFEVYSVVDGRIATGSNPASAADTANSAIKAFNSLSV
ncbi:hypothetical protein BN7_3612 [Wickerhamomyces ciferrii]|uniref:D-lactate dehydratase n=1 Tax=Wickerhamomyces ciferrii (strain ATCC 14091 / BCRC 22168 / CBS 111 / JCM 3599 / NBRC 0793 / NRRL Y-1031 F-60-10) TaxID=1206466 RepID=K0KRS7_WICCF|nr:uncharacterized protein BN7_3612 [Wickerhamomyces ciferrii]CCH44053.1 hypothetical protein BN7_3612 [Wickerhamomyces ciferrii]